MVSLRMFLNADEVARGVADGGVAYPVLLCDWLLDDLGSGGLNRGERRVEVLLWPG